VLDLPMTQAQFGALVGVSQQAVSELMRAGVLAERATAQENLHAYCHRLREQAAGRMGEGELSLVQERAALAREQRMAQEIRNAVARRDFAAVAVLGDVLANASQAVAERFDQLPGALRRECPDLPASALATVARLLASARNEWVRKTESIIVEQLEAEAEAGAAADVPAFDDEGGA
jgi:phage terminase Nu1 subunit (DNA packaging protein)